MQLIFSVPAPVSSKIKGILGVTVIDYTMSGMAFTLDDDDDQTGQEMFCLSRRSIVGLSNMHAWLAADRSILSKLAPFHLSDPNIQPG